MTRPAEDEPVEPQVPIDPGPGAKSLDDDLRSLRAKYLAILEEQVVVPLRRELASRQERLSSRSEALEPEAQDAELMRQGVQVEARKVEAALSVLNGGLVRVRSMSLEELQSFAGRSSAAE